MVRKYSVSYCSDRTRYFKTKAEQESLKGNYDKAGYYKTKAYQWSQRANLRLNEVREAR